MPLPGHRSQVLEEAQTMGQSFCQIYTRFWARRKHTFSTENIADEILQSQSARTENQRPSSQGGPANQPGSHYRNDSVSGQSANAGNSSVGGTFETQPSANNMLGGQQTDGQEHDPTGFSALYETQMPGGANGSVGGPGY